MRVLTVGNMHPPQHLGGYELVWQGSLRTLRDAGHAVRVLTTDVCFTGVASREEVERAHAVHVLGQAIRATYGRRSNSPR